MDTNRAATLARELMNAHGLGHVTFGWHRSNRAVGICHSSRLPMAGSDWHVVGITLSSGLVAVNEETIIRNTILHEIAHAKAGHKAGHGPLWKLAAIDVGARPEATCSAGVIEVPTKIQAVCPLCARVHYFRRMPKRTKYCLCQKRVLRQNWVGLQPARV